MRTSCCGAGTERRPRRATLGRLGERTRPRAAPRRARRLVRGSGLVQRRRHHDQRGSTDRTGSAPRLVLRHGGDRRVELSGVHHHRCCSVGSVVALNSTRPSPTSCDPPDLQPFWGHGHAVDAQRVAVADRLDGEQAAVGQPRRNAGNDVDPARIGLLADDPRALRWRPRPPGCARATADGPSPGPAGPRSDCQRTVVTYSNVVLSQEIGTRPPPRSTSHSETSAFAVPAAG